MDRADDPALTAEEPPPGRAAKGRRGLRWRPLVAALVAVAAYGAVVYAGTERPAIKDDETTRIGLRDGTGIDRVLLLPDGVAWARLADGAVRRPDEGVPVAFKAGELIGAPQDGLFNSSFPDPDDDPRRKGWCDAGPKGTAGHPGYRWLPVYADRPVESGDLLRTPGGQQLAVQSGVPADLEGADDALMRCSGVAVLPEREGGS